MPRPRVSEYVKLDKLCDEVYNLTGVTRKKCTVYKWAEVGRPNCHGKIVRLKTTMRLGRIYSTVEWLKKFIKEIA